ncbi:MAG: hypothetical protein PHU46_12685 [Rhodocyclaceae bacterium]|nr:hypothetical protein [Rhodocyclaceae bacterium]
MWHWNNHAADRRALGNYLANALNACPDECCQTWVRLAEIHRQAGNKTEFDILAGRLREVYNLQLPDWPASQ